MSLALGILISVWDWVRCCVELHYGAVLGKLSLLWLAISRLPRKLGHNSSPKTSHGAILLNRELKQARQRRQWKRQNSNRFRLAKQQLCTHITLFRTFLCRRCMTTTWKCLFSVLLRTCNTRQCNFLFLYLNFNTVLQNSTPKKIAHIWKIKRDGISALKFKAARIHFFGDVFVAVAVVVAKQMYK